MLAVTQLHLLLTLTLIHLFLGNPVLLSSFNFPRSTCANPPVMIAFLLSQLVMGPIDSAMGVLVNAITRKYEYEADRFACELGEDLGKALARSLETLHAENSATVNTDWLSVPFIVQAVASVSFPADSTLMWLSRYSAYHHNHPTLPERLRAIEAFNADYYGANKHLKVKPSVKSEL
jgi:STE24 endopeptidase